MSAQGLGLSSAISFSEVVVTRDICLFSVRNSPERLPLSSSFTTKAYTFTFTLTCHLDAHYLPTTTTLRVSSALLMAIYLPVLLGSVNAIPDDSALSDLPRGQVDYLSHEWREEDVWRSWRNMTRLKNEIANGVRLENASWRTWWKQRNGLKTVTPETLNWYVLPFRFSRSISHLLPRSRS